MSRFQVQFSDQESIKIDDIISFERDQIAEIKAIARKFTKDDIRIARKDGLDLSYLTDDQKQHIIRTKDRFFKGETDADLLKKKIVGVTQHSNDRNLQRGNSNESSGHVKLIGRLRKTNHVIKAQFKGYPTLSYTTKDKSNPDAYTIPISFMKRESGNRVIKIITVISENRSQTEAMETSLAEKNLEALKELKKKLN